MVGFERGRGTALITGGSSGIGAAFARRLGADGYDLVLVARKEGPLHSLAEELAGAYGIETSIRSADLASAQAADELAADVASMDDLELLVNGAGFGTNGFYADVELDRQLAMVEVQVVSPMKLVRAALPGMLERGRGAIVNISSLAAFTPAPSNATYCASKAFLNTFSEAIHHELEGTGVTIQSLCPGFTRTAFHDTAEYRHFDRSTVPQGLWMTAEEVVAESLGTLGRRAVCVPGFKNRVLLALSRSWLGKPFVRLANRQWREVAVKSTETAGSEPS